MRTHKNIEDARTAAKATPGVLRVIEIEHAIKGRCFIGVRAPMKALEVALRNKPMPEIKRLIAEYAILSETESAIAREKELRENTKCERCGKKIDGNTAYSQQEQYRGMRVMAHYCESCHGLLSSIGAGEYTELQERAAARSSYEPYTKEDY